MILVRSLMLVPVAFFWFVCLLPHSTVKGDFLYRLEFGQSQYAAMPNSRVAVDVFMSEYVSGTSASRFSFGNNDGLFSVGAKIGFSSTDPNGPAMPTGLLDVELDPNFNASLAQINVNLTQREVSILAFAEPGSLPYLETDSDPLNASRYSFRIATLFFNVGNQPSAPTNLTIDKLDESPLDNTLILNADPVNDFFPAFSIDDVVQGGFSSITAVPEPSSMLFGMVAVLGGIVVRMRRGNRSTGSSVVVKA